MQHNVVKSSLSKLSHFVQIRHQLSYFPDKLWRSVKYPPTQKFTNILCWPLRFSENSVKNSLIILSLEGQLWFLIATPPLVTFPVIPINTFRWHGQHAECYKLLAWDPPSAVIYPKWEYINNTDTTTSQVSGIQTHFHCVRGSCIIIRFIDLWASPAAILTSPKLKK